MATQMVAERVMRALRRGEQPEAVAVVPFDYWWLEREVEASPFVRPPRFGLPTHIEVCGVRVLSCPAVERWDVTVTPGGKP